jgi:hypothetical protein
LFQRIYRVDADSVQVFRCDSINTIKVTIPRHSGLGGPDETDFDGVQQFAPLLDIEVPALRAMQAPSDLPRGSESSAGPAGRSSS